MTFREFLPGYAVTSYGSQGKTVEYVPFSVLLGNTGLRGGSKYVSVDPTQRASPANACHADSSTARK
ncbi:MAG: hypothetical protein ACXWIU_02960 [Limisphaerales bacterium]